MTPAFRSDPPPIRHHTERPDAWYHTVERGSDGQWYFLRTYKTRKSADVSVVNWKKHPRLPEGRWQFTVRKIDEDQYGVWFRNLDGPLVADDA